MLKDISQKDPRFKIIKLSRNFGHQAAVTTGLLFASGKYVVIIDADLQDPPELIEKLLEQCRSGYDVVYGIRANRKESWLKRLTYWLFYRIQRRIVVIDIPLDSGDFCVMNRKVVDALNALPEHNRFVRGLRSWVGFVQTGYTYEREQRFAGEPKYGLMKLTRLALDGLFNYTYLPIRLATLIGFITAACCIVAALALFVAKIVDPDIFIRGTTTNRILILFVGAAQFILIGFLGEYITRIFEETKRRPVTIVETYNGFEKATAEKAARDKIMVIDPGEVA